MSAQDQIDSVGAGVAGAGAPAGDAGTPAPVGAQGAAPAPAPAAGEGDKAASGDKAGGDKGARPAARSRAESAMARALERAQAQAKDSTPAAAAGQQAATGDGGDGTGAPDADGAADPAASKAGAAAGDGPAPDSTLQAPQDWPREWATQFSALPTDEARQLVLAMNKDMTAGLQRGLQSLAEQRRGSESLFEAMKQTGHEPAEVTALLGLSARFKDDPRGVLESLAQQAGIDLAQLAEDKPPEFADAAELAKWASDKARRDLERQLRAERQREEAQRQQAQVQERFMAELKAAAEQFGDLKQQWPAVAEVLARHPLLSVAEAYRVASFDRLQAAVAERDALKAQVAKLQAAEEMRRKQATAPPPGAGGNGVAAKRQAMSRAEAAMARAERRLAAQGAA